MRKIYFLGSLFILFILFFIAGCKKNLPDTTFYENNIHNVDGQNVLSIKEAQNWYAKQSTNFQFRNGASENKFKFKIRTPYWDKAVNTADSNYYIVETPAEFDQSPGFTFSNPATKPQAEKANDVARLLILKDKKTGEMRSALMHIVTDNGIADSSVTYSKRNKNFSGFIFYSDIEGNFINGWKYENGKITRRSRKTNGLKSVKNRMGTGDAISLIAPPEPEPVDCSVITVTEYVRDCTIYPNGEKNCTPWRIEGQHNVTYCISAGGSGGIGGDGYNENDTPSQVPPNANQDIIDSLKNYPCAQEILKQLPSINAEIDSILKKIFGANEDVNLKFTVDNSLTKDSLDGYTKSPGGSAFFFDSKIELNPWVLNNSSKEYILVTMLHEAIHSYIDYWYVQYLSKQIDSAEFKTRFPIFWNYNKILNDPNEIAQHNEMANNYISTMKNAIESYNPNANDDAAEALAWGGLQKTTVWKTKSDTSNILNINWNSRDASLNKYSQYNFQKCGNIPVQ